jgi:hypothetical protein
VNKGETMITITTNIEVTELAEIIAELSDADLHRLAGCLIDSDIEQAEVLFMALQQPRV